MLTKCYKCGHKNEKDSYACSECGEIFWASKEKYDTYIKEKVDEQNAINKEHLENKKKDPNYDKDQKYPISRWVVWVPLFMAMITYNNKQISPEGALSWVLVSLISFFLRKLALKIVPKYKWYTEPLVVVLSIVGIGISYVLCVAIGFAIVSVVGMNVSKPI